MARIWLIILKLLLLKIKLKYITKDWFDLFYFEQLIYSSNSL